MNDSNLAYNEKDNDLSVRIAAHKKYASVKIETLITDFLRNKSYERVCDVGCGSGNYTGLLAKQARVYVGLDINNDLLKKAGDVSIEASSSNTIFMRWDINNSFPFINQSFDLILSAFSAYYVNDASQLVKGFYDLLAPGGMLCILGPAPGNASELDQISKIAFGKSATTEKDMRLDRLKNEFLPLINDMFSGHRMHEFDISLVFPNIHEFGKYYMATPQYKELSVERGPRNVGTIIDAVERISSLKLTKKVLMLGAERIRI